MRNWGLTGVIALLLCSSPALAGEVTVVMKDGRVTVIADQVPLRQILAEWARVGQTKIVGAELLSGTPLTLRLENVPERQALETLLRAASGYLAAPRAGVIADASSYDRIMILPTSTAPPASAAPATARRAAPSMAPVAPEPPEESVGGEDLPADFPEALRYGVDPAEYEGGQQSEQAEDQPAEATFDYANPQLMLRQRQQRQQEQEQNTAAPMGSARPGTIVQPAQTPNVFPGTVVPSAATQGNTSTARPGEIVAPPPTMNPYGLPAGVQPGSVQGAPVQPDRSKYMNPYQPSDSDNPPDE
jgi:hypothetical protein